MNAALHTLLDGVLDYAGLFPPARLSLEDAASNYAKHRRCDDAWMLRHFVVPVDQLDELADLVGDVQPWSLSVLGRRCETSSQWRETLADDVRQCSDFQSRHGEKTTIAALELALPSDVTSDDADHIIQGLAEECSKSGLSLDNVFLEVPSGPHSNETRMNLAKAISRAPSDGVPIGLKLRTGGLEAAAFPSCEQLTEFIFLCHNNNVAWKATAGLHHPLPQVDAATGATMHGFVNLLCAVALADDVDRPTLCKILADQDPTHFAFTEDSLRWCETQANLDRIRGARTQFISFGSCSFDEPREDLINLGYSTLAAGSTPS